MRGSYADMELHFVLGLFCKAAVILKPSEKSLMGRRLWDAVRVRHLRMIVSLRVFHTSCALGARESYASSSSRSLYDDDVHSGADFLYISELTLLSAQTRKHR